MNQTVTVETCLQSSTLIAGRLLRRLSLRFRHHRTNVDYYWPLLLLFLPFFFPHSGRVKIYAL